MLWLRYMLWYASSGRSRVLVSSTVLSRCLETESSAHTAPLIHLQDSVHRSFGYWRTSSAASVDPAWRPFLSTCGLCDDGS